MTRKINNELSKKLLEEGKKRDREEFGELVKKGVFKDTEEDYTRFVVCKYCNYNNHDTNCCMILPEENNKCPLLIIDYDEKLGKRDMSQEEVDKLMEYVSNLRNSIKNVEETK